MPPPQALLVARFIRTRRLRCRAPRTARNPLCSAVVSGWHEPDQQVRTVYGVLRPRTGYPVLRTAVRLSSLLCRPPAIGQAVWDGSAGRLGADRGTVGSMYLRARPSVYPVAEE